ncbi:MAG: hypothetical protein AB1646_01780 [Thermodesulfobacteriota bacterium]
MITNLRLVNFKVWHDSGSLQLAPITVLFGTNNAGKSSVLQSLRLLKRTVQSQRREVVLDLAGTGAFLNLGQWMDMIHGHDVSRDLTIGLQWRLLPEELRRLESWPGQEEPTAELMSYELTAGCSKSGHIFVRQLSYRTGTHTYCMERKKDGKKYNMVSSPQLKRRVGRPWDLPAPLAAHAFPPEVTSFFQDADFTSDLGLLFQWLMSRVHYVGPLRIYPERTYLFTGGAVESVGPLGENTVHALLAVINSPGYDERTRKTNLTLVGKTNRWLKRLGVAIVEQMGCEIVGLREEVSDPRDPRPGVWFREIPKGVGFETADPSDRKFIAVALAHPDRPPILYALDVDDWEDVREVAARQGLSLIHLCPQTRPVARKKRTARGH